MHPRRPSPRYAAPGAASAPRFLVLFGGQRIGSTNLELADAGLGFASGRFHPEPGYEAIRAEVVKAAEARQAGAPPAADAPLLALATAAGEIVKTDFVTIDDSGGAAEPEISVAFKNPRQFFRLVK